MKSILIVSLVFLFCIANTFAQTNIETKTVVYDRKGEGIPSHKKTFEVRYPVFKSVEDAGIRKELENSISYWRTFETTLEDNLTIDRWIDSLDYKVNYNSRELLDIELSVEGSAAYPDGSSKTIVVDLRTGKQLGIGDVFVNIGDLVLKIDEAQKEELRQARTVALEDGMKDISMLDRLLGDKRFRVSKLDQYSISDQGVTFIYDYGFPHAAKELEPEGRYFFSWSELKTFIRKDGRLNIFVS